MSRELLEHWLLLPQDEHIALHETMMAFSVKMMTKLHLGEYFKDGSKTFEFQTLYEKVRKSLVKSLLVTKQAFYPFQIIDEIDGMYAQQSGSYEDDDDDEQPRKRGKRKALEADLAKLRKLVGEAIKARKEARLKGTSLKAPFMDAVIEFGEKGGGDEEQMVTDCLTYIFASFQTCANVLTW